LFYFGVPSITAREGSHRTGWRQGHVQGQVGPLYWSDVEGEGAAMGEAFTRANKYVLTRGDQPLAWANSHRLKSIDDVAALKQDHGPDLIMQGSSTLYPPLLAAGLIDRLMLMTFPVMLGKGKRLFGDGTPTTMLKMVDHTITARGTVIATYERGGSFPPFRHSGRDPARVRARLHASAGWQRAAGDRLPSIASARHCCRHI
jgi:dihydrofolate reductase